MRTNELRVKRAQLVESARNIYERCERENRQPTADENRNFDLMMADADKIASDIERHERLESEERALSASQGRYSERAMPGRSPDAEYRGGFVEIKGARATVEYRAAYETYVTRGPGALSGAEHRALSAENDTAGGYLLAPQQTVNALVKAIDNIVVIRQLATKFMVNGAESLGCPSLDADPADSDWTSEIATGSEDSTMAFGKRELHPRPLAKRIKISRKLLSRLPGTDVMVTQRLAYKFGVSEEKAFMTGTGANGPLGVFTASSNGISTGRDVTTGSTTAITPDSLFDAFYALKQPYQASPSLAWVFHRDAVKQLAKAKSGDGMYLWQPSLSAGQPDTLLGKRVVMSEYAPNTFTTGLYVGIVGDFSHYWIADADTFSIQRLDELYAESNQVGLIGRKETDGMPVLEEAFARLKTS
jgi:HK97 family phage major capsid protein